MRNSTRLGAAAVATTITLGTAGLAVASRSDEVRVGSVTVTRLHDDDERSGRCPSPSPTTPTAPSASGGTSQTITVTIERTTLLRVDRRGRITAAATNTGCRPQRGDRVYVIAPTGTYTEVRDVDLDEIEWKGSFRSIGRFERQSGRERLRDDH